MMIRYSIRKLTLVALAAGLVSTGPATAADPLKVGFVYVAPIGEAGWTYAHDLGRKAMEAAYGDKVKTSYVENVAEGPNSERVIRNLAQDGNKLIFTTSFGYMDPTLKVARTYPKAVFQHATGYKTATNMGTYDVRTYEGAYLAGVLAGKTSKSKLLGMVASFPIPEVIRNINAFTIGARSVDPAIKTRVIWVSTWYDPGKERQAALTLISQGADVLMQNTDSPAIVQAAEEKGVHAFGWDSDMTKFGARAHLGASEINWGVWYKEVTGEVLAGTFKPRSVWYGLKEGAIDLGHINAAVSDDIRKVLAERRDGVISGKRPVFMGPLKDQAGALKVPEGKDLPDEEKHKMNYYVEGVEGSIPG
jgi:simple sugar transport system substrate-binding protein